MVRRNIPEVERLRKQACKAPARCCPAVHCLLPGLEGPGGEGAGNRDPGGGQRFQDCGDKGKGNRAQVKVK